MTGERDGDPAPADAAGHTEPPEAVGSVGEEAAKLLGALSEWARDREVAKPTSGSAAGPTSESAAGPTAPDLADTLAEALHRIDDHVSEAPEQSADCRWCPVCRVIHAVRETSPEVREHLATAAGSFLHAAAGMLATHVPQQGADASSASASASARDGVEHIDLGGEGDVGWDPDEDQDEDEDQRG